MVEKELELITWDNIRLCDAYPAEFEVGEKNTKYKVIAAFSEPESNCRYTISIDRIKRMKHTVKFKLIRDVKTLGQTFKINVINNLDIDYWTTFKEVQEKYPTVAKAIKKDYNKGWMEEANKIKLENIKTYKAKIQKQYDELKEVYTALEYKKDVQNLEEMNSLLYCEAEGLMMNLEERINKKANAKNIRLYKALQELRNKPIITCSEG